MSNKIKNEEVNLGDFGTAGAVNYDADPVEKLDVSSFPKEFFTICPDPEMVFTGSVLQDSDYIAYLVKTTIAQELGREVKVRTLYLAQTVSRKDFVLSIAAPTAKNRQNAWVQSGQEAIRKGMKSHIRVSPGDDSYRIIESQRPYPKTIWPDLTIEDMIEQAFGERLITDLDHPLIKELLGL